MSTIYAISGLSGSGKTSIARILSNLLWIPPVVTYTTRPIRPDEEDGKDYNFVDDKQWDYLIKSNSLVATQDFHVATGDIWRYGILKEDLKRSCIMVLTPSGVSDLRKLGYNVVSIYIDIEESLRLSRITSRNDNQTKSEIERRSREDKVLFKDFKPDFIVSNNGPIYDTVDEIIKLI